MENQKLGAMGEGIAKKYLQGRYYKTLFQNLRLGKLEIDLVVQDPNGVVVIVEVKTIKKGSPFHKAQDNYTNQKRRNIQRAAQKFLGLYPHYISQAGIRIDLITIELTQENSGPKAFLAHHQNI